MRAVDGDVTLASHKSLFEAPVRTGMSYLRIGCAGFGVVFCLFAVATIWLFDTSFKMNGQEVMKPVGTLIVIAFMAVWISITLFILGRMEQAVRMFLGRVPRIGWRLYLSNDQWIADQFLGFNVKSRTLTTQDFSAVQTDDSGCLVVNVGGRDVPITMPLEPDVAEWMKIRLSTLNQS